MRKLILLLALPVLASAAELSPRIANYDIHVKFDPTAKTLEGDETIVWRHEGENPLASLQFHLYWNAFRDKQSSFSREAGSFDEASAGSIELTSVRLQDQDVELVNSLRYIHPDDDNARDRTVAEVPFDEPLDPGQTLTILVRFKAKFPGLIARAGTEQDFFMAGQWFPKIGVMRRDLWNTHQYHRDTEFFADFGVYNVTLTLPQHYVVAASGDLVSATTSGKLKTLTYRSEDVHDFSWSAWPRFRKMEDHWRGVRIELYYPPEDKVADRHMAAAKATLEWFDRNVGTYPYPRLVIVDVPEFATEAGGMEYPTLVTTDSPTSPLPFATWREPEVITIHEIGHQYFYGMLASNEFEEAWLDEGINSYTEAAIADWIYGRRTSLMAFGPWRGSDAGQDNRPRLLHNPVMDPVLQPAWRYVSPFSYATGSYARPLYLMRTAEELVGQQAMYKALRLYFERWQFKHPTTRDFLDSVHEATGQDLEWFFHQALSTTGQLDYSIESAHPDGDNAFRVRVIRLGEIEMPVELTVHYATQREKNLFWDGRLRWHDFSFEKGVESPAWYEINTHAMDVNPVNNSYSVRADQSAVWKLGGVWTFFVQHLMELAAWLV